MGHDGQDHGDYDGEITFLFCVPIIITLAVMLGFYLYEGGLYFIKKTYRSNAYRRPHRDSSKASTTASSSLVSRPAQRAGGKPDVKYITMRASDAYPNKNRL